MSEEVSTVQGIKAVNAPTRDVLDDRQLVDYEQFKTDLIQWLLNLGKSPETVEGYAPSTARQVAQKTDKFFRWHWTKQEAYTSLF